MASTRYATLAANLAAVTAQDPEVGRWIAQEVAAQDGSLKLIASENYCSPAVLSAMATPLTDKYAEGVPGKRFYSGCANIDAIESLATARARELFGARYAYVQPHSGADANLLAFWAILRARVETGALRELGLTLSAQRPLPSNSQLEGLTRAQWGELRARLCHQRLLAMEFRAGGHLTHGSVQNVTSRMFEVHTYGVNGDGLIDYGALAEQAQAVRPLILLAGYSAYPRTLDFAVLRRIADQAGAVLMVDMAHFAGLVAGKWLHGDSDPVPFADVVTFTTHKTLRGPRGGAVLARDEFAEFLDRGCPMVQGGPLPHVIAAKAICFAEAAAPEFRRYAAQVVHNSRRLAERLRQHGCPVVSGGTDNHLVLVDLRQHDINGYQAEEALRACGISLNRNMVPGDRRSPIITSGLRLGTAAVTTLGMTEPQMDAIAALVARVVEGLRPGAGERDYALAAPLRDEVLAAVRELMSEYAPYRTAPA